jgi:hypothetical protein
VLGLALLAIDEKACEARSAAPDGKGDVAPEEAVHRAFDGVDMSRLEERFWKHVERVYAIANGK